MEPNELLYLFYRSVHFVNIFSWADGVGFLGWMFDDICYDVRMKFGIKIAVGFDD